MKLWAAVLLLATAAYATTSAGLTAYRRGDHAGAYRIWLWDSERGYRESQYHLALLYRDGEGVGKNPAEALKWLKLSAQAGCDTAQMELGIFLDRGTAGPADPVQAREWFERAAQRGNRGAMNELGRLYFRGRGVPVDDRRAFDLFQQASYSRRAAMFNLGLMYETGRGHPKDLVEAVAWYSLAAGKGEPDAAAERDALSAGFSPDEKRKVRSRVAALHRRAMFFDFSRNGFYYLFIARHVWVFVWGVVVLTGYFRNRLGWKRRSLSPAVQQEFRERTGSTLRRCFLFYRPWGVLGWCLHLWFFLVLAIGAISALALATMPVDEGWIGFAVSLLVVLFLSHALAIHRDKHALGRLPGRLPA